MADSHIYGYTKKQEPNQHFKRLIHKETGKNLLKGDETLEYLAEQASKGNEECFVMICRTLEKKLFRAAKGVLGNETLSFDAVSEAVFRAFKGLRACFPG